MDLPLDLHDLAEVERKKLEALSSIRPLDASSTVLGQYASYNLEVCCVVVGVSYDYKPEFFLKLGG